MPRKNNSEGFKLSKGTMTFIGLTLTALVLLGGVIGNNIEDSKSIENLEDDMSQCKEVQDQQRKEIANNNKQMAVTNEKLSAINEKLDRIEKKMSNE